MIRRLLKFLFFVVLAISAMFRKERMDQYPEPAPSRTRNAKQWLLISGVLLAVLGTGGFLVAVFGIIPIKASSGHWAITEWFLNFAKERSVATHTIGKKAPPLDAPSLVAKGATHYETGCRSCHGSPGMLQPPVARGMTPTPPALTNVTSKFKVTELFYIVKHGIKFTGMPAWPAEKRDDEVWAVVAFLLLYPGMDAKEYRRLAFGEMADDAAIRDLLPPEKAAVLASCGRCHGRNGLGREGGAFPKLAGQKPEYILASLEAYASGKRPSGIMEPIAAGLSVETMREFADHYGNLPGSNRPAQVTDHSSAIERGRTIALNGIPGQRVPACVECHGRHATPRNPFYPLLSGQPRDYLILQLELFKKKARGGTRYSHLMHFVAGGLTMDQMNDVAHYFASLAAEHK